MKTKTKFIPIFLFTILIINSCQSQKKDEKIELYSSEFNLLKKELMPNHEILKNGIYYLIYNNSCEPCVVSNIFMLEELPSGLENFIPMFLGKSNKINVQSLYEDVIKEKFNRSILIEEFSIQNYKLDVTKPLLLHFKKGELVYLNNYNDFEMEDAKDYILSNLE
jgi:hypothetical protein